jgi:AraC-like DNA-binding protein
MNDYIYHTDRLFFKHEISENVAKDTYSMHVHNGYEVLYFLSGNATCVIEDRRYKLRRGDLIFIRPMQYHFIQIDEPETYERYDILFDPLKHGIEGIELMPVDTEVINISGNAILEQLFRKLDFYRQNSDDDVFERILYHLISELFYNISLSCHTMPETKPTLSPLISKALKYTNENLCTVTGISEIANNLFVSESYLFRLFKNELHQTPKKYIREKRLLMAQKMLMEGEKPTRVSERCGFSDYTTFYRNYTAFFGRPPRDVKGDWSEKAVRIILDPYSAN